MSDRPLIATPDQIIAPGIDSFVEARPAALKHINYGSGVYSHIFTGMRGQSALALRRLTALAAANRLDFASGPDLLDLAAGEFDTEIDPTPQVAAGEIRITRPNASAGAGVIKRGTIFTRIGNPSGVPLPCQAAQYESVEDVFISSVATAATIKVHATRPGTYANHVYDGQLNLFSISTPLFDPSFAVLNSGAVTDTIVPYRIAGGSDAPSDQYIRLAAKKYSVGQYAPNQRALIAGMLLSGARHVAVTDDDATGIAYCFIADESWSSSAHWLTNVYSTFVEQYLGFGCKVRVSLAYNLFIHVDTTVVLRDAKLLNADLSEVNIAIQKAIQSYFNDRQDWYTWSLSGLKAAVSRAHPYILMCNTGTVKSRDGLITYLDPMGSFNLGNVMYHFYLADNSTTITYQAPT